MKKFLTLFFLCSISFARAQDTKDLFTPSDTKIYWLGIDFSNVKLIGDFSQIGGAGEKSALQIKRIYFPAWNRLVLDEREKYDLPGMLRKDNIIYDIDMVMDINKKTPTEEMESYNAPKYTRGDIENFVKKYDSKNTGIGIVFIAESLNKANTEAYFHFVAIDLTNNNVLLHDRIRGEPSGIGLRNYWAGAIYDVIKEISKSRYRDWKSEYARK